MNLRRVIGSSLLAFLCGGCAEVMIATAMTRYEKRGYPDYRMMSYSDCTQKDNSSWDVIDACMVSKGFTLKK